MRRITNLLSITILLIIVYSCSTESTPVYQLSTSVEPSEAGTVTPSTAESEEGDSIQITANANEHWVFDRWSGDYSGTENPASILMDADKSVTALFEKRDYPLTIDIDGEGTVDERVIQQKTTDYPHGTVVELTANPAEGWEFIEWGGDVESEEEVIEINIDGDTNVTVTFERMDYPLTITIEGEGEVEQEIISSPKTTEYPFETVVELTAVPNEGWEFSSWEGAINSTENSVNYEMGTDNNITAIFERKEFTITVDKVGEGSVSQTLVSGTETDNGYLFESLVELSATPSEGWKFSNWSGDVNSSEKSIELNVLNDLEVIAEFEIIPTLELWQCDRTFGCDSRSREPTKVSFPYTLNSTSIVSTTSNTIVHGRYLLKAIGKSYKISKLSANDRNGITSASFSGIENGTVLSPGDEVEFAILSGRTSGQQSNLQYYFEIEGENLSFSASINLQSNIEVD